MVIKGLISQFQAAYLALELTRRKPSDSVEKLTAALSDAQVDLNPHQVEAALFAFRSPLSRGAILADEVGLGKTIEAGLLLAQKWAERKRRLLIILPANLRKQWAGELADKFFLPTVILENRTFNAAIRAGNLNPFEQNAIVLCSYHFARSRSPYIEKTLWDLVVVDEAHRLRNVYKNSSKIALAIKAAIAPFQKVLLTATPLQNSILELFGLVSIIDEFAFGDLAAFRSRFGRLKEDADFEELRERLKLICKRTLRRQVLEYVKYTNRIALVQEFTPSEDERRLYDLVSEYLQRDNLYALPSGQRHLMTLILRKLLASSTHAISHTLKGLADRLELLNAGESTPSPPGEAIEDDWESFDELEDEWDPEESDDGEQKEQSISDSDRQGIQREIELLREFHQLAASIAKNSKGEVLLTALRRGFQAANAARAESGAVMQQKAIVFTESRRTQEYLLSILEETEFKGQVVLFNGQNNDLRSREIYKAWAAKHAGTDRISGSPGADMRAALVEHFRDQATIMIATEAAAEGINLQFCNLVVNYDLPWNPQRIEQRIGRCHRYGQQFDVVVVNFLNKENAADVRVYQLLDEKFKLFDGVFGASDEVLGAVESGIDFEKRIAAIYQSCRSTEQIQLEFDFLQKDLEIEIDAEKKAAREKLLNNFDQEVIEKVRIDSKNSLDRFAERLWTVTRFVLRHNAQFDEDRYCFDLKQTPENLAAPVGLYSLDKRQDVPHFYRPGHVLAEHVLKKAAEVAPRGTLRLHITASGRNVAALDPLLGQSGWLRLDLFTVVSLDEEDHLVLAGVTDAGQALEPNQCKRLLDLPGTEPESQSVPPENEKQLDSIVQNELSKILGDLSQRDGAWFEAEMAKLDRWAEDRRLGLKVQLEDLDTRIRDLKKEARMAPNLPEKLKLEQQLRTLDAERNAAWKDYDTAAQQVEQQKDSLLDVVGKKLKQNMKQARIFTIRWELV